MRPAVRGASEARGGVAHDLALQLISAFRGRCGRADLDLHRVHRAPGPSTTPTNSSLMRALLQRDG